MDWKVVDGGWWMGRNVVRGERRGWDGGMGMVVEMEDLLWFSPSKIQDTAPSLATSATQTSSQQFENYKYNGCLPL